MKKKSFLYLSLALLLGGEVMAQDIIMQIKGQEYVVSLVDNAYTKDLIESLPQTLVFDNFGRNERVADLKERIGQDSYKKSLQVKRGDLTYYVPWGNLAAFRVYYSSPSDLVPLGSMSEEAISALENSGESEVTFKLP